MKFYIHPINPHYSAASADDAFDGWLYGIWQYPWPALDSHLYEFQSKHLVAAEDTQRKAEKATSMLKSASVGRRLVLPLHTHPHSMGATTYLHKAHEQQLALDYNWKDRADPPSDDGEQLFYSAFRRWINE